MDRVIPRGQRTDGQVCSGKGCPPGTFWPFIAHTPVASAIWTADAIAVRVVLEALRGSSSLVVSAMALLPPFSAKNAEL
jgi:hypothetical protein